VNSGDIVGKDRGESLVDTGRCPTATCGLHVYVPEPQYQLLRETGSTFYCAAGHSQSFTPKPKIDERAKRLAAAERDAERLRRTADEAARRCPWPTCEGRLLASPKGLRQHMVKAHGAPWLSPEISADDVGQILNGRDPAEVIG
jgi:hypothetical protein